MYQFMLLQQQQQQATAAAAVGAAGHVPMPPPGHIYGVAPFIAGAPPSTNGMLMPAYFGPQVRLWCPARIEIP